MLERLTNRLSQCKYGHTNIADLHIQVINKTNSKMKGCDKNKEFLCIYFEFEEYES